MKPIYIDDRLKDIASLVDNCDIIADIGTDHGYLPIFLLQNKIAKFAYACDVAKGPLQSAIDNLKKYNLQDNSETILTDGLINVPAKVNTIIIAGMGGNLIIDILKNRQFDFQTYILQPNIHHYALRKYLMENNFQIVDEKVSYAQKKYYEIIKVKHGKQTLNENELLYGPINLSKKSELFINKWIETKNKLSKILVDFKGSKDDKQKIIDQIDSINLIIK